MMFLLLLFLFSFALPHDLDHRIEQEGSCLVVYFFFPDGGGFSYEAYEVLYEGGRVPFQVGRSDALGRVVFCPNREGFWIVKISSEDGHGATIRLKAGGKSVERERDLIERYERLILGIGFLLGIFGFFQIFIRRSKG